MGGFLSKNGVRLQSVASSKQSRAAHNNKGKSFNATLVQAKQKEVSPLQKAETEKKTEASNKSGWEVASLKTTADERLHLQVEPGKAAVTTYDGSAPEPGMSNTEKMAIGGGIVGVLVAGIGMVGGGGAAAGTSTTAAGTGAIVAGTGMVAAGTASAGPSLAASGAPMGAKERATSFYQDTKRKVADFYEDKTSKAADLFARTYEQAADLGSRTLAKLERGGNAMVRGAKKGGRILADTYDVVEKTFVNGGKAIGKSIKVIGESLVRPFESLANGGFGELAYAGDLKANLKFNEIKNEAAGNVSRGSVELETLEITNRGHAYKGVWGLTSPERVGFYYKITSPAEYADTLAADKVRETLAPDRRLVIPKVMDSTEDGILSGFSDEVTEEISKTPMDEEIGQRKQRLGSKRSVLVEQKPTTVSLYDYFTGWGEAQLPRKVTEQEMLELIEDVEILNRGGVRHGDLLNNMYFDIDNNDRFTATLIDYERANADINFLTRQGFTNLYSDMRQMGIENPDAAFLRAVLKRFLKIKRITD